MGSDKVPSQYARKYLWLAVLTAFVVALDILVIRRYPDVRFLAGQTGNITYLAIILVPVYLFVEFITIRNARMVDQTRYSFNERGIYRNGLLAADWSNINSIHITRTYVAHHISRTSPTSGNLFFTDSPINQYMIENKVSDLTNTVLIGNIRVRSNTGGLNSRSFSITTSPSKGILKKICRKMLKRASGRGINVEISLDTSKSRSDEGPYEA